MSRRWIGFLSLCCSLMLLFGYSSAASMVRTPASEGLSLGRAERASPRPIVPRESRDLTRSAQRNDTLSPPRTAEWTLPDDPRRSVRAVPTSVRHPEPSSFAAPVFDPPQTLTVPSLGIVASVVPVGVDPSGVLALTADPSVVFWYEASGYPGLIGRMVLAGHLDSRDGSTGIFAQLARVQVGEEFEVTTARGARYRYRVTGLTRIEASDIARALSAPAIESEALLVTCDGRWDPRLGRYSHNLLVRGVLVPLQGDDAP